MYESEYGPPDFSCDPSCPDFEGPLDESWWMRNRHCGGCEEHVRNPDEKHMIDVHNAKPFSWEDTTQAITDAGFTEISEENGWMIFSRPEPKITYKTGKRGEW